MHREQDKQLANNSNITFSYNKICIHYPCVGVTGLSNAYFNNLISGFIVLPSIQPPKKHDEVIKLKEDVYNTMK